MPNDNVTTLYARTHAIRRAMETYAKLHPAQADPQALEADFLGFLTDMLTDAYVLAAEKGFDVGVIEQQVRTEVAKEIT